MGWLETLLATVAGLLGGFISTLASNGSTVTLPALESLGLPEHVANGTNRLSVVALGLVGTVGFYRQGLVDWRKGGWIAALVGLGTIIGSFVAVELGEAVLDGVISAGLFRPRVASSRAGALAPGKRRDTQILRSGAGDRLLRHRRLRGSGRLPLGLLPAHRAGLSHGLRPATRERYKGLCPARRWSASLLIFGEAGVVDWIAGIPLALGSAAGAYAASLLAAQAWGQDPYYRFLVLVVILAIVHLLVVDTRGFIGRGAYLLY